MMIPKLTISYDASMVPPLPPVDDPHVQIWRDGNGIVCAYGHVANGRHWMHLPGIASYCFGGTSSEVVAVVSQCERLKMVVEAYNRAILPIAMQVLGHEVLHASAVLTPAGVVAFCAMSGTGKSTIAFGLRKRGFHPWADDAVAFDTYGTYIMSQRLPFRTRLRPSSTSFFREGIPEKDALSGLGEAQCVIREAEPITALFLLSAGLPAVSSKVCDVSRLSSSQAFSAVLPHAFSYCESLFQDMRRKRKMVENYLSLVACLPVYQISFRSGLESLRDVLDVIEDCISAW